MWGCDLTPFYDETGSRLMSFTAFLPLGMRLAGAPKFIFCFIRDDNLLKSGVFPLELVKLC